MSDINRLPRRYKQSFRNFASASEAVLNMALIANPSYHTVYTHFLGDALTAEWPAAKTNGTSAAVTVATSRLTLTTGTDDNGYAGQGFGLHWKGDNGVYFTTEFTQLTAVTSSKIEVGLTDAVDDAGAVNAKSTPTATADDFVVLVRDTDDNTELDLISAIDTVVSANAENVYTVAIDTAFIPEFRYQNDACAVFVNGSHVGSGACQGGDLVTPWWFAQARAGSASRVVVAEWGFCTGPAGI